jgi:uncharacterized protein YraI
MRTLINTKFAVAALVSTLAFSGATFTSVSVANAGVTGCTSSGGRQEGGALIGALAGAALGSQISKNERGLGAVAGAGLGAAAGSAIGCEQQKKRDARYGYSGKNAWVAHSNLNIRSAPSTRGAKIGSLVAGERFQSMGATRGGQWVMVGRNGRTIGYVSASYVSPV